MLRSPSVPGLLRSAGHSGSISVAVLPPLLDPPGQETAVSSLLQWVPGSTGCAYPDVSWALPTHLSLMDASGELESSRLNISFI